MFLSVVLSLCHNTARTVCCQLQFSVEGLPIWMLAFLQSSRTQRVCSLLPVKFWSLVVGGGLMWEEAGGDLSSAAIVLERDDLIGKCFMDNNPTLPCSMHSDPTHQLPHPQLRFQTPWIVCGI